MFQQVFDEIHEMAKKNGGQFYNEVYTLNAIESALDYLKKLPIEQHVVFKAEAASNDILLDHDSLITARSAYHKLMNDLR